MDKAPFIVHDLKTDRSGISGGLPSIFRLVPLMFYICAAGAIALNIIFYLNFSAHNGSEENWNNISAQAQYTQTQIIQKQKRIMDQARRAEEVADWLEGSRPVQPIGVTISRSIGAKATIAELDLTRSPDMPAHLFMTLKLNGTDDSRQLESTLDAIAALSYQTYSADETKGDNAIDFSATLIWNNKPRR